MRLIEAEQLDDIALGAAVLGTGGGGDPYIGKLMAQYSIRKCGPVQMVVGRRARRRRAGGLLGHDGRADRHGGKDPIGRGDRDGFQGAREFPRQEALRDHVGRGRRSQFVDAILCRRGARHPAGGR